MLSLLLLPPLIWCQIDPDSTYPPHGCENYGLCSQNNFPNVTEFSCPDGDCVCQEGYSGDRCQSREDPCQLYPCPNEEQYVCIPTILNRTCVCAENWAGDDCSMVSTNLCLKNPCQHDGECVSTDNSTYTCNCKDPYTIGANCEHSDPCTNQDLCKPYGSCSQILDNQDYFCDCDDLHYGRDCEKYIYTYQTYDSRHFNSCLTYDTALMDEPAIYNVTHDESGMTYTECQNLLTTTVRDPPYTMMFLSGGYCWLSAQNTINSSSHYDFGCKTRCPNDDEWCGNFVKRNGQTIAIGVAWTENIPTKAVKHCSNATLMNQCLVAEGFGKCISVTDGILCICKAPTYVATPDGTACKKYDICTAEGVAKCKNEAVCIAEHDESAFTCQCAFGFSGDDCSVKMDCTNTTCYYGGTCENTPNGPICHCLKWYDPATNCSSINICQYANPCVNGTCVNNGTGIQIWPWCKCDEGWEGENCDIMINLCVVLNNPCQNDGVCNYTLNNYTCTCVPGTEDGNCSTIINLCETKDARGNKVQVGQCNANDDEAKCIGGTNETINKVLCECSADWMGDFCDMNVIIYNVMMALYGRMDYTLLPLLNDLLASPAQISDLIPFMIGTLPESNRTAMSWQYNDMFSNSVYEEKKLEESDFVQWNDVVLGNCFTFNHPDASVFYDTRSSGYSGGLRATLKVNQHEYAKWTDTAAILTFIHFKDDYIMSESIRYNAEPSSEVIFFPYRNKYTRLQGQYGTCVNDKSEVKAFYFPASYTTDACLRSCYQDKIEEDCGCMDPRYPMSDFATPCVVSNMSCIEESVRLNGDPSNWTSCVCPLPCTNTDYQITLSKGGFRAETPNCLRLTGDAKVACLNQTTDTVTVIVSRPQLVYNLFTETPTMELNDLIGSLGGLLGVLMGICAMTFVEIGVVIFRVIWSLSCKPKPKKTK